MDALCERFWEGAKVAGAASPALEAALRDHHAQGAAAWPEVKVEPGELAAYLGEKAGAQGQAALAELRGADLYLAVALLRGDPAAVRRLEQLIQADLPAVLASVRSVEMHAEDLKQALLERLLVAGPDRSRARIGEYSGRGNLRGWVRVSLTRLALNQATRGPKDRAVADEDALLEPVAGEAPDPELDQMRRLYRADFKTLLREAIAALTPQERNLLRHRYLDGLQVDGIAAIYGIHRVTAARQLAKARGNLLRGLREKVALRWKLTDSEASSMARLMRSELNLSLRNAFGPTEPGD